MFTIILLWSLIVYILLKEYKLIAASNYESAEKDAKMFFLIPIAFFLTWATYFITINIWYIPKANDGYSVFLTPRYYLWMNNMPSQIFAQWKELSIIFPILCLVVYFVYWTGIIKNISFRKFAVLVYFLALVVEFLFTLLTANGLDHLVIQAKSLNNGIWYLINQHVLNVEDTFIKQVKYLFSVMFVNHSGYAVPGLSHPPGNVVIALVIHKAAKFIGSLIFDSNIEYTAITWTMLVAMINTLIIPIILKIAKEVYSEKTAKFTGVMLIVTPSVCIHFCSLYDGIASLFMVIGILMIVYTIKSIKTGSKNNLFISCYGIVTGVAYTLAAQMAVGLAFPIISTIIAFLFTIKYKQISRVILFFLSMCIAPLVYFIFEYLVSDGKSFYFIRALENSKAVEIFSVGVRPYPISQIANFVILSVFGGALFLPTVIKICSDTVKMIKNAIKNNKYEVNDSYKFIYIAAFIMFILVATQKAVLLEAERSLFWFFIPIWVLMGYFFNATNAIFDKVFEINNEEISNRWYGSLILCYFQMIATVVLAMSLMDYY